MHLRNRSIAELASLVCGEAAFFPYRTHNQLEALFDDVCVVFDTSQGSRSKNTVATLRSMLRATVSPGSALPDPFLHLVQLLMDLSDGTEDDQPNRAGALNALNQIVSREGLDAYYAEDGKCYLRESSSGSVQRHSAPVQRAFTPQQVEHQRQLELYLDRASEDQLIENVLLPLFRHSGFQRISSAGHKDKALEYGKDVWMKFTLPTRHVIYFGLQAKRGRLDASGRSTENISEVMNQVRMMLGHEVFDPDISKTKLVDHAFIVSAGEITKAARNWLAVNLDRSQRSQILFMDRSDILDLFVSFGLVPPQQ